MAERINHHLGINNSYTGRLRLRNTSYLLSKPLLDRDSHREYLPFNFKKELPYHEPRKDGCRIECFQDEVYKFYYLLPRHGPVRLFIEYQREDVGILVIDGTVFVPTVGYQR